MGTSPLFYPRIIMVNQMFYQDNGVKGMLLTRSCSSPSRVFHAQQVDPDRQPVTVSNKDMLTIATWNVRPLYQKGKLANVQQETDHLQIDILGLCEILDGQVEVK